MPGSGHICSRNAHVFQHQPGPSIWATRFPVQHREDWKMVPLTCCAVRTISLDGYLSIRFSRTTMDALSRCNHGGQRREDWIMVPLICCAVRTVSLDGYTMPRSGRICSRDAFTVELCERFFCTLPEGASRHSAFLVRPGLDQFLCLRDYLLCKLFSTWWMTVCPSVN